MDGFYRARLQALAAVDELVDAIVTKVEKLGIADNTYIIFTSDNGFHMAQHRLPPGKGCAYEEDINVPFMIRGPGISKGRFRNIAHGYHPHDLQACGYTTAKRFRWHTSPTHTFRDGQS